MRLSPVGTALLCAVLLTACKVEVYKGLTQREANEMVAVLTRAGIDAKREPDGTNFKISVPDKELGPAVAALKRAGFPRDTYKSLGEIFPGDGLVVSPYEQRIRMMFAMNQEVSRTLSTIQGVVTSRVHIVVPELDLRGLPMGKPTASVVVHHRAGVDVMDLTTKIKTFVANSVQGLHPRDVAVSFFQEQSEEPAPVLKGGREAPASPEGSPAASLAPERGAQQPDGFSRILSVALWLLAFAMALVATFLAVRHRLPKVGGGKAPAEAET